MKQVNIYDTFNSVIPSVQEAADFSRNYDKDKEKAFSQMMKRLPMFAGLCVSATMAIIYASLANKGISKDLLFVPLGGAFIGGAVTVASTIAYHIARNNLKIATHYRQYRHIKRQLRGAQDSYKELKQNIYDACILGNQEIDVGYMALLMENARHYYKKIGGPEILLSQLYDERIKIENIVEEIHQLIIPMKQPGSRHNVVIHAKKDDDGLFTIRKASSVPVGEHAIIKAMKNPNVSLALLAHYYPSVVANNIGEFTEKHMTDCDYLLANYKKDELVEFFKILCRTKQLSSVELNRICTVTEKNLDEAEHAKVLTVIKESQTKGLAVISGQVEGKSSVILTDAPSIVSDELVDAKTYKNIEIIKMHLEDLPSRAEFEAAMRDLEFLKKSWLTAQYRDTDSAEIVECVSAIKVSLEDMVSGIEAVNAKKTAVIKKQYLKANK